MRFLLSLLVPTAYAQVQINTGINATFPQVMGAIVNFLAGAALAFCTSMFFIGALYLVGYAAQPDKADQGKKIMKNSIIGLGIILGSYGILRTAFYILIG